MGHPAANRKPVEQHIFDGTWNATRHPKPVEIPKVVGAHDATPPDTLDAWGRAAWERLYPQIQQAGFITDAERGVLHLYCEAYGTFCRACDEMNKSETGPLRKFKKTDDDGNPVESWQVAVWYRIKLEASDRVLRCAQMLGLTPVDRSRVVKVGSQPGNSTTESVRPKTALDKAGPLKIHSTF